MARDPLEVLVGTGTLYAAPLGEAFPTDPTTAVAGNWEDVGYSDEGWSFVADRTFEDVEVAEEADDLFQQVGFCSANVGSAKTGC